MGGRDRGWGGAGFDGVGKEGNKPKKPPQPAQPRQREREPPATSRQGGVAATARSHRSTDAGHLLHQVQKVLGIGAADGVFDGGDEGARIHSGGQGFGFAHAAQYCNVPRQAQRFRRAVLHMRNHPVDNFGGSVEKWRGPNEFFPTAIHGWGETPGEKTCYAQGWKVVFPSQMRNVDEFIG